MHQRENLVITTPLELFGNGEIYFSKPSVIPIEHTLHYRDSQLRDASSAITLERHMATQGSLSDAEKRSWVETVYEHVGYAQWSEAYWLAKMLDKKVAVEEMRTVAPLLGAITLYEFNHKAMAVLPGVTSEEGIGFNMKHLGWAFSLADDMRDAYPQIRPEIDRQQQLTSELLMELALLNPAATMMDIERMSPRTVYLDPLNSVVKSLKDMIHVRNLSVASQEALRQHVAERKDKEYWRENIHGLAEFIDLMAISECITGDEAAIMLREAVDVTDAGRVLEGDSIIDYEDSQGSSHYAHSVRKLFFNTYRQLPERMVRDAEAVFQTRYLEAVASRNDTLPENIFSNGHMVGLLQEKLRLPVGQLSQADKTVLRSYFDVLSSDDAHDIAFLPLERLRVHDIVTNDEVMQLFDTLIQRAFPYLVSNYEGPIDSYPLLRSTMHFIQAQIELGLTADLIPTQEIKRALELLKKSCLDSGEFHEDTKRAVEAYFKGEIIWVDISEILSERLQKQGKKRMLFEDRWVIAYELNTQAKLYVVETLLSSLATDKESFLANYKQTMKTFREENVDDEDFSDRRHYQKYGTNRKYKKWGFRMSHYWRVRDHQE